MAVQARLSLHLSKYHIVGNQISQLNYYVVSQVTPKKIPVISGITKVFQILENTPKTIAILYFDLLPHNSFGVY